MDFRLLGSVAAVAADGRELPVGSAKRRSLLAMLLLNPGAPVTVDRLTETLWDEEPPRHSRTVIHNHVSGLRALLAAHGAPDGGVELVTDGGAYLLRVPDLAVDTDRFERLLRSAGRRPTPPRPSRRSRRRSRCGAAPRWPAPRPASRCSAPRTPWRSCGSPPWRSWPAPTAGSATTAPRPACCPPRPP
ncbi:hypothetical protein ATKI12_9013 [Kitasatospora sp. Ki12]